jgi:hypothetical protein
MPGLIDMEKEENKAIASLQEEVFWLSRSLRLFIAAFVAASSFRLWTALRNGTEYKEFFGNMLAGAKIPDLTILLADYHVHIYALSVAVSALVVFYVLKKNSQPALLGLASVVGIANFAFAEFANYWFWKPVAEVMRQLTG